MDLEELKGAVDGYHETVNTNLSKLLTRIEQIEAKGLRPGATGRENTAQIEHRQAFAKYLRTGEEAGLADLQGKAMTIGVDAAGGYGVPEELGRQIDSQLLAMSPIRQIAQVVQASTADFKQLVSSRGATSGWAGETDTRSETSTPTLEEVAPTFGELYAVPKVSEWVSDDFAYNLENWLMGQIADEFAYQEGVALITGNGTNKPTGFLNGTPVSTGDADSPARAFGVLQYIPTGEAAAFPNDRTGSPPGNPVDPLITCYYALNSGYRANAVWVMSSATMAVLAKFKDGDGNYLIQRTLIAGQPDLLLGKPIVIAEGMPSIGAGTFPIAFGDFTRGYLIVDRTDLRITRDPITSRGHVLFYTRKRIGGKLLDSNAIKVIKVAVS